MTFLEAMKSGKIVVRQSWIDEYIKLHGMVALKAVQLREIGLYMALFRADNQPVNNAFSEPEYSGFEYVCADDIFADDWRFITLDDLHALFA